MAQRRGGGELGEVVLAGGDVMPVGAVEESPEDVFAAHLELEGRARGTDPDRHDDQHQEERRQQAPGSPVPEGHQVDRTGSGVLAQQQAGDEVARQDEEDVDAEEPAADPAVAKVIGDDGQDRDRSDAVESGAIAD